MRVEFASPFVDAALSVTGTVLDTTASTGDLSLQGKAFISSDVTVIVGIVGELEGVVLCSMPRRVALLVAGRMLGGTRLARLDELARSAVSEFVRMVTQEGADGLSDAGFDCQASPPVLLEGAHMQLSTFERTLCIPLEAEFGIIRIIVDLREAVGA